jgi:OOP family OmpA-OmpF porin
MYQSRSNILLVMKKILLLFTIVISFSSAKAQILDRMRSKVERKLEQKIDESIDKATQPKKKKTPTETKSADTQTQDTSEVSSTTPASEPVASSPAESVVTKPAAVADLMSYSKFDFIPGDKVIVHEDFSQEATGDFPANWNTRSGAEVVTLNNRSGKWLRMAQSGVFYPEYVDNLPENFTVQLEVIANKDVAGIGQWMISLMETKSVDEKFSYADNLAVKGTPNFKLCFQPAGSGKGTMYYSTNVIGQQYKSGTPEFVMQDKPTVKVAIWRQKQRIRVYLDSTKVLDLPRALDANTTLNSLVFSSSNPEYDNKEGAFFMSNIVVAVGAPDLRNKLVTEGKFSTNGILFDVNSDKIKPESYGSIQSIAQVLKDNATLKVNIIGHTDADGTDAGNLDLSKRRALAVKQTLTSTFGIDAARLESDGKGKSEPVDANDTPAGKANNRRVEFIKI